MLTRIAEVLKAHKVKNIDAIIEDLEPLLTKSPKVARVAIERERVTEAGEEIFCRDFSVWMPREFGALDKNGKYLNYSKLAGKALAKYNKIIKALKAEAFELAMNNELEKAQELKEQIDSMGKFAQWVKNEKYEDYI